MKNFNARGACFTSIAMILTFTGCAVLQRGVSRTTSFAEGRAGVSKAKVTQAELQDDLLRFESQFNARIQGASQALEASKNPRIRYRAALNRLIYSSNSLGIALGPSPESNLLDMVAFIELSHAVLQEHWAPTIFGEGARELDQAFEESKQQVWQIAGKVMDDEQRALLETVISEWRQKHLEQINVETVRLSAFSSEAGAKAAGVEQNIGGLFASVQQSTQAVDAARLFAERALYYAERAPFLFRLQARLGINEVIEDAGLGLSQLSLPRGSERTIKSLMNELQQTLLITRATLDDANSTVRSVSQLMAQLSENPAAADSARRIVTQLSVLLREWNALLSSTSGHEGDQVSQQGNRWLARLAYLGAGLIAFFWLMYLASKLTYQFVLLKFFRPIQPASREQGDGKKAA